MRKIAVRWAISSVLGATSSLAMASQFASIAISPSHHTYGSSHGQPDRSSADQAALAECGQSDCIVQVWVVDGCVSLAGTSDGTYWGTGWANGYSNDARDSAKKYAVQGCAGYVSDVSQCHVALTVCSWDQ